MTGRGLKIALGLSVALNIFVSGAAAGALIVGLRAFPDRAYRDRPPVVALIRSLDFADRERVERDLRSSALAARADFQAARRHRLEAVDLAGAETFDRAAVEAALARARQAEGQGRDRLEDTLLDTLEALDREDRQRLAPALARRARVPPGGEGALRRAGPPRAPGEG